MKRQIKKNNKRGMTSFLRDLLIALLIAAIAFGIIIVLKSRGFSALEFIKNLFMQRG